MSQPIGLMSSGGLATSAPELGGKTRPQLEKAALQLYDPAPSGIGGKPGSDRGSIPFQFNPKEVTIQKAAKWERKPARSAETAGPVQFTGAEPCKLTLEMFFDASDTHDGSVVEAVEKLFSCCVPTKESLGKDKGIPPIVVLRWGKIASFPAFVTSVSAKYTLFSADGVPIRALCSVSMEEMPNEPWRQNPTSGGQFVRRSHTMVDGDTLAGVAYQEYGDPAMWRALAAYNRIDDPLRFGAGSELLLPSPAELI
jgi:nucleoid-associated protein YgaU